MEDMKVTRKCELCDTCLIMESGGRRLQFTAHDVEFCRSLTLARIRTLEHFAKECSLRAAQSHHAAHQTASKLLEWSRRLLDSAIARDRERSSESVRSNASRGQPSAVENEFEGALDAWVDHMKGTL